MKKYIKPETNQYAVELQPLMDLSNPKDEVSGQSQLGKENDSWYSDESQWDEEE